MATELFGLAAFVGLVLASGIGALLALRTFFYGELDLTKNEVRTGVEHLSYERAPGDE
ncbi:hypothetical protein [Haladaptatus salinisoli]|uniref:hypothetical protein n=1 Tax=Haladaptatus salinisoli TaxID=2884876 RepID=UPI001D0B445C|nr:hypothetical protein [Haladaptatus salinisoli]